MILDGYLRYQNSIIIDENQDELINTRPFHENYSCSYSFCLILKDKIIIANDCIGVYPLQSFYHFNLYNYSYFFLE